MGKLPWFRLYTEIRTDPKMQALSDSEFRLWINLLCIAADSKVRGIICIDEGIPYPDDALARALLVDTNTLTVALEKFEKLRMAEIDNDGVIYILNFDSRQYDKPSNRPDAVNERVRKHRAKVKEQAESINTDCNANVTPLKRQCNTIDTDTDTDKELSNNPPISPLEGEPVKENIPYAQIVGYLNQLAGTSYKHSTESTKRKIKARWNEGFRLDDFKAVIDKKTTDWKNDPKMFKYLRPETLFGSKFDSYLNQGTGPPNLSRGHSSILEYVNQKEGHSDDTSGSRKTGIYGFG